MADPSTNHAEVADTLHRAADLIEERGWTNVLGDPRDAWGIGGGPVCLEGGIAAAAGIPVRRLATAVTECPAYGAVWDYLQNDERWGMFRDRLYDWNDVNGRTALEVVEVLRAAAAIEQAKVDAEQPAEVTA